MKRIFRLGRIVAFLALAGLVIAPLGTSTAAPAMAAQAMAAMADDMPCCPEQKNSKAPCPQDCPVLVLCVAGLGSLAILGSVRINFGPFIGIALEPGKAFALGSLPSEPPSRPPRA